MSPEEKHWHAIPCTSGVPVQSAEAQIPKQTRLHPSTMSDAIISSVDSSLLQLMESIYSSSLKICRTYEHLVSPPKVKKAASSAVCNQLHSPYLGPTLDDISSQSQPVKLLEASIHMRIDSDSGGTRRLHSFSTENPYGFKTHSNASTTFESHDNSFQSSTSI